MKRAKQQAIGLLIATQSEKAIQAFMVAGAEVLEKEFKLTKEQQQRWALATIALGQKYLRVDKGGNDAKSITPTHKRV